MHSSSLISDVLYFCAGNGWQKNRNKRTASLSNYLSFPYPAPAAFFANIRSLFPPPRSLHHNTATHSLCICNDAYISSSNTLRSACSLAGQSIRESTRIEERQTHLAAYILSHAFFVPQDSRRFCFLWLRYIYGSVVGRTVRFFEENTVDDSSCFSSISKLYLPLHRWEKN